MSNTPIPRYTPAKWRKFLAKNRAVLIENVIAGYTFICDEFPEPCPPKDAIKNALGFLACNEATRRGKHTFIRESDIIEYVGSNLGMALAALALAGPLSTQALPDLPIPDTPLPPGANN